MRPRAVPAMMPSLATRACHDLIAEEREAHSLSRCRRHDSFVLKKKGIIASGLDRLACGEHGIDIGHTLHPCAAGDVSLRLIAVTCSVKGANKARQSAKARSSRRSSVLGPSAVRCPRGPTPRVTVIRMTGIARRIGQHGRRSPPRSARDRWQTPSTWDDAASRATCAARQTILPPSTRDVSNRPVGEEQPAIGEIEGHEARRVQRAVKPRHAAPVLWRGPGSFGTKLGPPRSGPIRDGTAPRRSDDAGATAP